MFFSCDANTAEELGWSLTGARIEKTADGYCYAMIGMSWDDSLTDAENDAEVGRAWNAVVRELNEAGIYCDEED